MNSSAWSMQGKIQAKEKQKMTETKWILEEWESKMITMNGGMKEQDLETKKSMMRIRKG